MIEVKPLKYKSLPGLSERQLSQHHDVYIADQELDLKKIKNKSLKLIIKGETNVKTKPTGSRL